MIPVLLAIVFASAFEPVMKWLRARMPSVLATVIVLLGIVVVIGGVAWTMVRAVISQWSDLYDSAVAGVNQVIEWVNQLPFAQNQARIDEWWASIQDFIGGSSIGSTIGSGAVAGVGAVASFVTGLVLMVVVLFFFLKDGPVIWGFLLRPFRGEWFDRMERIGTKSVNTLGAYVRGTAAVAAVDAIGIGLGLFILDIPLAFPLTLLVFLLAFIPIVGATLAGILAALLALVDGGWMDNGLLRSDHRRRDRDRRQPARGQLPAARAHGPRAEAAQPRHPGRAGHRHVGGVDPRRDPVGADHCGRVGHRPGLGRREPAGPLGTKEAGPGITPRALILHFWHFSACICTRKSARNAGLSGWGGGYAPSTAATMARASSCTWARWASPFRLSA